MYAEMIIPTSVEKFLIWLLHVVEATDLTKVYSGGMEYSYCFTSLKVFNCQPEHQRLCVYAEPIDPEFGRLLEICLLEGDIMSISSDKTQLKLKSEWVPTIKDVSWVQDLLLQITDIWRDAKIIKPDKENRTANYIPKDFKLLLKTGRFSQDKEALRYPPPVISTRIPSEEERQEFYRNPSAEFFKEITQPVPNPQAVPLDDGDILLDVTVSSLSTITGRATLVDEPDFNIVMVGFIEIEWDDSKPTYLSPELAKMSDAYSFWLGRMEEEDWVEGEDETFDLSQVENPYYAPPLRIVYDDGTIRFRTVWTEATLWEEGNPVYLWYEHDPRYGMMYRTGCNHFWLEHLDKGSVEQCQRILKHLQLFRDILEFKQEQKGGRKKRSEEEEAQSSVEIMRLRHTRENLMLSDEDFLKRHPDIKKRDLRRAKEWLERQKGPKSNDTPPE